MPPLLSTPLWIRARDFDLDYHLRRVRAPGDASLRTVLEPAAILVRQAFDPQRPPWECTLLESVEKGRAALILKLHHSITDGVGGVKLAARIARMGVTYLEVQGRAVESLPAREYTDYAWCFKALPACESGGGFDGEPLLVRLEWRQRHEKVERLEGELVLRDSPFDPVADLPVRRLLRLEYDEGSTQSNGRVLRSVPGDWLLPFLHQRYDDPTHPGIEV